MNSGRSFNWGLLLVRNGFGARKFKVFCQDESENMRYQGPLDGKGTWCWQFQIILQSMNSKRVSPKRSVVEANNRSRDSLVFLWEGSPSGLLSIGPKSDPEAKKGRTITLQPLLYVHGGGEANIYHCIYPVKQLKPDVSWLRLQKSWGLSIQLVANTTKEAKSTQLRIYIIFSRFLLSQIYYGESRRRPGTSPMRSRIRKLLLQTLDSSLPGKRFSISLSSIMVKSTMRFENDRNEYQQEGPLSSSA